MALLNASGDMENPSAAELQEADDTAEIFTLATGTTDDGQPYWMYSAIRPSRYQAYMADTTAKKRIEIEHYGRALKFGFDAVPPAEAKEEMRREYGFDEHYEAALADEIKKERGAFFEKKEAARIDGVVAMLKKLQGTQDSQ